MTMLREGVLKMDLNPDPDLPPWLAFTLGSAAGTAALLRSGLKLTWRRALTAVLYNGLASLAVAWLIADKLHGDARLIGGVCVLSGIGGAGVLDVVIAGIRATLTPGNGPK